MCTTCGTRAVSWASLAILVGGGDGDSRARTRGRAMQELCPLPDRLRGFSALRMSVSLEALQHVGRDSWSPCRRLHMFTTQRTTGTWAEATALARGGRCRRVLAAANVSASDKDTHAVLAEDIRVTFSFGERSEEVQALKGASLRVARGTLHMLLGPNGCGKARVSAEARPPLCFRH